MKSRRLTRKEWLQESSKASAAAILFPYTHLLTGAQKKEVLFFKPDWSHGGIALRHSWEGLGNVDQLRWIVRGDMQQQLGQARRELNILDLFSLIFFAYHVKLFDSVNIIYNKLSILVAKQRVRTFDLSKAISWIL